MDWQRERGEARRSRAQEVRYSLSIDQMYLACCFLFRFDRFWPSEIVFNWKKILIREIGTECVAHRFIIMKRDDYFESILTTFKVSVIFLGSWGSSGNWLKSKTKPALFILSKLSLSKYELQNYHSRMTSFQALYPIKHKH